MRSIMSPIGPPNGTLRTGDHATWYELEPLVRQLVTALLVPTGVGYVLEHLRGVPPVVNESMSAGMLRDAAVSVLGMEGATTTEQSSGGEDFAWYLEKVPGAMGRLGVWPGHGPMRDLHQPAFELDERALPIKRGEDPLAHQSRNRLRPFGGRLAAFSLAAISTAGPVASGALSRTAASCLSVV